MKRQNNTKKSTLTLAETFSALGGKSVFKQIGKSFGADFYGALLTQWEVRGYIPNKWRDAITMAVTRYPENKGLPALLTFIGEPRPAPIRRRANDYPNPALYLYIKSLGGPVKLHRRIQEARAKEGEGFALATIYKWFKQGFVDDLRLRRAFLLVHKATNEQIGELPKTLPIDLIGEGK